MYSDKDGSTLSGLTTPTLLVFSKMCSATLSNLEGGHIVYIQAPEAF